MVTAAPPARKEAPSGAVPAPTKETRRRLHIHADGYAWVKYGEKNLAPSGTVREYYKCRNWRMPEAGGTSCPARKVVDRAFSELMESLGLDSPRGPHALESPRTPLPRLGPPTSSPRYTGASPRYTGASPQFSGASPRYTDASPRYTSASPSTALGCQEGTTGESPEIGPGAPSPCPKRGAVLNQCLSLGHNHPPPERPSPRTPRRRSTQAAAASRKLRRGPEATSPHSSFTGPSVKTELGDHKATLGQAGPGGFKHEASHDGAPVIIDPLPCRASSPPQLLPSTAGSAPCTGPPSDSQVLQVPSPSKGGDDHQLAQEDPGHASMGQGRQGGPVERAPQVHCGAQAYSLAAVCSPGLQREASLREGHQQPWGRDQSHAMREQGGEGLAGDSGGAGGGGGGRPEGGGMEEANFDIMEACLDFPCKETAKAGAAAFGTEEDWGILEDWALAGGPSHPRPEGEGVPGPGGGPVMVCDPSPLVLPSPPAMELSRRGGKEPEETLRNEQFLGMNSGVEFAVSASWMETDAAELSHAGVGPTWMELEEPPMAKECPQRLHGNESDAAAGAPTGSPTGAPTRSGAAQAPTVRQVRRKLPPKLLIPPTVAEDAETPPGEDEESRSSGDEFGGVGATVPHAAGTPRASLPATPGSRVGASGGGTPRGRAPTTPRVRGRSSGGGSPVAAAALSSGMKAEGFRTSVPTMPTGRGRGRDGEPDALASLRMKLPRISIGSSPRLTSPPGQESCPCPRKPFSPGSGEAPGPSSLGLLVPRLPGCPASAPVTPANLRPGTVDYGDHCSRNSGNTVHRWQLGRPPLSPAGPGALNPAQTGATVVSMPVTSSVPPAATVLRAQWPPELARLAPDVLPPPASPSTLGDLLRLLAPLEGSRGTNHAISPAPSPGSAAQMQAPGPLSPMTACHLGSLGHRSFAWPQDVTACHLQAQMPQDPVQQLQALVAQGNTGGVPCSESSERRQQGQAPLRPMQQLQALAAQGPASAAPQWSSNSSLERLRELFGNSSHGSNVHGAAPQSSARMEAAAWQVNTLQGHHLLRPLDSLPLPHALAQTPPLVPDRLAGTGIDPGGTSGPVAESSSTLGALQSLLLKLAQAKGAPGTDDTTRALLAEALQALSSQAESQAKPLAETQSQAEPQSHAQPLSQPQSEAEPLSQPQSQAQPLSQPSPDAQPGPGPSSQAQTLTLAHFQSRFLPESTSHVQSQPQPQPQPLPQALLVGQLQQHPQPQPKAQAQSEPLPHLPLLAQQLPNPNSGLLQSARGHAPALLQGCLGEASVATGQARQAGGSQAGTGRAQAGPESIAALLQSFSAKHGSQHVAEDWPGCPNLGDGQAGMEPNPEPARGSPSVALAPTSSALLHQGATVAGDAESSRGDWKLFLAKMCSKQRSKAAAPPGAAPVAATGAANPGGGAAVNPKGALSSLLTQQTVLSPELQQFLAVLQASGSGLGVVGSEGAEDGSPHGAEGHGTRGSPCGHGVQAPDVAPSGCGQHQFQVLAPTAAGQDGGCHVAAKCASLEKLPGETQAEVLCPASPVPQRYWEAAALAGEFCFAAKGGGEGPRCPRTAGPLVEESRGIQRDCSFFGFQQAVASPGAPLDDDLESMAEADGIGTGTKAAAEIEGLCEGQGESVTETGSLDTAGLQLDGLLSLLFPSSDGSAESSPGVGRPGSLASAVLPLLQELRKTLLRERLESFLRPSLENVSSDASMANPEVSSMGSY